MIRRATSSLALALALGGSLAALGGCSFTLFPKEAPAQLYRFGESTPSPTGSGASFAVRGGGVDFERAAAGDAILTVQGHQVAYVSGGRWASPAPELFEAAVRRGFSAPNGQARLIEPGEPGHPQYVMRLAVTHFEADYEHGPTAAPTVIVTLRAVLTKTSDQSLAGAQPFEAKVEASDNRIGAIAEAFDTATSQVVGQLVGWVDQVGGGSGGA